MKIMTLAFSILFLSCKNKEVKDIDVIHEIPVVNDQFQAFLHQFSEIKLPIKIIGCKVDFEELQLLNPEISNPYEVNPCYVYGKIKTNGNYMATITLGAADCFLPILTTYKLNGEKINSQTLSTGICDEGPCYVCEETMEVNANFNISITNNITYSECDDNYEPISGTEKKETLVINGKLTTDGFIQLNTESNK